MAGYGSVEIVYQPNGNQDRKRYIAGVAVETIHFGTNAIEDYRETHYLHKDHLGSLDVITDASGAIVQEQSFDAWGQRRNATDWAALGSAELLAFDHSLTTRGFTGHEMLDEVGIIHMNGRIYDPKLARFLQADPIVQEPTNSQSLNRYSYVFNNPLNATDPSGFSAWTKFRDNILKPIAAIVISIYLPGSQGVWGSLVANGATVGTTVASGFVAGLVATGNLQGATLGAFSAGLFFGVGKAFAGTGSGFGTAAGRVAAHGMAGGIVAELQGGKFGHGFAAAGFTQALSGRISSIDRGVSVSAKRIVAAAVVGGTASRLSGGKFANGAITGAFSRAFNDELDHSRLRAADEAWERIDEFIKNNPDAAVSVSADDFKAILDADAAVTARLRLDELSHSEYLEHIQDAGADSKFFQDAYRDHRFLISGHPTNGGAGILGSDINYYQVGMDTAAAGQSMEILRGLIVGHNARDIWNGRGLGHNMRQMYSGQYWAQVGYDHYSSLR